VRFHPGNARFSPALIRTTCPTSFSAATLKQYRIAPVPICFDENACKQAFTTVTGHFFLPLHYNVRFAREAL
jgi:hypothetical protein